MGNNNIGKIEEPSLYSEKLSQQKINRLDEISIFHEFKKQLLEKEGLLILEYEKLEENGKSKPDFKCKIKGKGTVFVEVTQVFSADDKTISKNKLYEELETKVEKTIRQEGLSNMYILINPNYYFKVEKRKKFLEKFTLEITKFLKQYINNANFKKSLVIKLEEIEPLSQVLSFAEQITIWKNHCLKVEINKWISDPEQLARRIEKAIQKKENKNYKENPLWLVIRIDDNITNTKVLKDLLLKGKTKANNRFDRIYIQLSYCPATENYTLFRLI
ncbi:hypothetical protein SAMN06265339_0035 [Desulfurobacterium pacificum]|uniref:Uncharacterized protein n=1 Tax=Desulfurobacterium pacificum TaxID=240166 RepID=A0ABY1N7Q1_9BACT|nr:hypothetical protein [Desulfurobacterium pacificum]SMP02251.1 hypothetical protein SAMN06265339_0035 [Desulfurobacterium pacificum]